LPGNHQTFVAECRDRALHGHLGYAVVVGQLCHRWQSITWRVCALVDCRTQSVGNL
jgi:hypothetical protein